MNRLRPATTPDDLALRARIVITGLGLVTSLGQTAEETWAAVVAGRIGIGPMSELEQALSPERGSGVATGGQAVEAPAGYREDLPRTERLLRLAIESALGEAGVGEGSGLRIAVVLGSTLHGMRAGGEFLRSGDARRLQRFLAGSVLDECLAGLPIGPIRLTTCSACSSGLGSVGLGITLLNADVADIVVVGGYDSVSEYAYGGFDGLRLVAEGPPRPFDVDRDGMKVAEGYAAIVIERAEQAVARGALAQAVIGGVGETSDAFHLTQPHPEGVGAAQAMRSALMAAGVGAEEIDMIAAHATATPNNDAAEYAAIARTLGSAIERTPVVAFKGHLGHTLGAAGGVELALSVLAMRHGMIPATANTRRVDPAFKGLQLLRPGPVAAEVRVAVNLSLGFGGANTCVVLTDPERPTVGIASREAEEPVITGIGLVLPGAIGMEGLRRLLGEGGTVGGDTGAIPESEFESLVRARRSRRMSEYAKLTLAAASAACEDAGLAAGDGALDSCCGLLGTTHGATGFCEAYYAAIVRDGLSASNPVLFAEGVPNAAAAHLSMGFGLTGSCQTINGSRSAGLHALMLAAMRIREGMWTRAIVSAGEEYSAVVNAAYGACGLYGGASGFAVGSGAVALVVESRRAAEARSARVWGGLGRGCWAGESIAEVVGMLGSTEGGSLSTWGAVGPGPADRLAAAQLARAGPGGVHRTVYGPLPELFSAGPLAALAAGLLGEEQTFAVVSREFGNHACGLVVRKTVDAPVRDPGG